MSIVLSKYFDTSDALPAFKAFTTSLTEDEVKLIGDKVNELKKSGKKTYVNNLFIWD